MSGVTIGSSPCCSTYVWICKPDGTALGSQTLVGTNGGFVDTRIAARGRRLQDPRRPAADGDRLDDAHALRRAAGHDDTITPGGPPVTVSTRACSRPERDPATFAGTPGPAGERCKPEQRHDRHLDLLLGPSLDPQAGRLDPRLPTPFGTSGGFLDTRTLPVSGTYTILVDPQLADLGSMTLTLYDVPPDVTSLDHSRRPPVTVSMGPVPGQNALVIVLRHAGPADRARHEQRHDRHLALLLGPGLDLEAGRLDARLCDAGRDERRLPRHARRCRSTGIYTILVDPQEHDARLDDVDALRRPA